MEAPNRELLDSVFSDEEGFIDAANVEAGAVWILVKTRRPGIICVDLGEKLFRSSSDEDCPASGSTTILLRSLMILGGILVRLSPLYNWTG